MTINDLINILQTVPNKEASIVISKDPEGNEFSHIDMVSEEKDMPEINSPGMPGITEVPMETGYIIWPK